ncbi:tumor necrosis factor alpha-induced protein 8-like protein [Coccinella septempunctata]|uniref:tumor necrosis factor alpha-induced protein 8-like protein n=1 Tax=Coccinella septempunctata TaxID=41139 RepID=UPI001D05E292|nr:tumor necrosis factor alpha-induced protein 8-like protein [Coccinella septempunctata]
MESMNPEVMTEGGFRARDISLRAQKKLLSKMSGKNMSSLFLDEYSTSLLDNLYTIAKKFSSDKKESEKLIKNIIKTVIKFAILYKNQLLDPEQKERLIVLKEKLRGLAMNIITFYDMEFTYDRIFLTHCITECHNIVMSIAQIHLSPNSIARINRVFNFFGNEQFLDVIFNRSSDYREPLGRLVKDLHHAIDNDLF